MVLPKIEISKDKIAVLCRRPVDLNTPSCSHLRKPIQDNLLFGCPESDRDHCLVIELECEHDSFLNGASAARTNRRDSVRAQAIAR
jgi:hypothetical protein